LLPGPLDIPHPDLKPFTRLQQVGLFLTLFFAYELLGSREPPWNDGKQIHQVAEAIVQRHAIDVRVATPVRRDGKNYAAHPLLASVVHVPGARIHQTVIEKWPQADGVARVLGSHLAPAFLGALVCWLFALLCRQVGISSRATQLGAVMLGLGTMVAVYARSPWSEIAQTAAFTGFFLGLMRVLDAPGGTRAFSAGFWAGLLINTKLIFMLSLPGALAYVLARVWRRHGRQQALRVLGWAVLGFLPGVVAMLAYNHARTGSLLSTGYSLDAAGERVFGGNPLAGLWGLFLSPGKSLFLYCPPLVVSALALPWALRTRDRAWWWALLLTAGPPLYVYARFVFWSGDWCWGPRYILFLVPILLLPAVFALDRALLLRRRLALVTFAVVLAAGLAVQVAGSSFYWDHFIRIAQEARTRWLGSPNRAGAATKVHGVSCDPCFEDFYEINWLPPFNPIEGHFWLLRHVPVDHDWRRAEADAPWHRYTTLQLDIAASYPRARMDWWYLEIKTPFPHAGKMLLWGMSGGLALAMGLWSLGGWLSSPRRRRDVRARSESEGTLQVSGA
jgi:hypothetical protein